MEIKRINSDNEIKNAIALIMDTYNKTEAINDTKMGRVVFKEEFGNFNYLKSLINSDELLMLGVYDDSLKGVISATKDAYIMHLFIKYDSQGKGYASTLLKEIEAILKSMGHKSVRLDSSIYASTYYLSHGYKEIRGVVDQDGMKYIPMEKSL